MAKIRATANNTPGECDVTNLCGVPAYASIASCASLSGLRFRSSRNARMISLERTSDSVISVSIFKALFTGTAFAAILALKLDLRAPSPPRRGFFGSAASRRLGLLRARVFAETRFTCGGGGRARTVVRGRGRARMVVRGRVAVRGVRVLRGRGMLVRRGEEEEHLKQPEALGVRACGRKG